MFEQITSVFRLGLWPRHRPPSPVRVLVATVVAVAGSLTADAALVAAGNALFPTTTGYTHFQFADYAKLTVIGVLVAGAGWLVMARVTDIPRLLFAWAGLAVTLVLLLPDAYLLYMGQPGDAVAVLVAMHLAIAFVTYGALVTIAPVGADSGAASDRQARPWVR